MKYVVNIMGIMFLIIICNLLNEILVKIPFYID